MSWLDRGVVDLVEERAVRTLRIESIHTVQEEPYSVGRMVHHLG